MHERLKRMAGHFSNIMAQELVPCRGDIGENTFTVKGINDVSAVFHDEAVPILGLAQGGFNTLPLNDLLQ